MTSTNGVNPTTAEEAVLSEQELGALLVEATSKAVKGQIGDLAKQIAKEELSELLTGEVIERMRVAARAEAEEALAPPEPVQEPEPKKLAYTSVEEFVEKHLRRLYRRDVFERGHEDKVRWCPQWHEHGEAVARLESLWLAWEHLRHGEGTEQSQWWVQHADPQMAVLMDPEGPFKHCSYAAGHNGFGVLEPLPLTAAPEGAFIDAYDQLNTGGVIVPTPRAGGRREVVAVVEFP